MPDGYEIFSESQARRERETREALYRAATAPEPTEEERWAQLRSALFDPQPPRRDLILNTRQAAFLAGLAEAEELNQWMQPTESTQCPQS